jgi:hypothetical protein
MINELHGNPVCGTCNHFGYCKIYWGPECKRQGGDRTPRLKSTKEKFNYETVETVRTKRKTGTEIKPDLERVSWAEPIRTRVVNW